ncbi:hypothetical protein [Rhizobium johnstonii]|uniref:hypothetical protein n=1 Tax=Rhizobium johnstonii TaxID=3019933 RepID=UPI003F954F25
MRGERPSGIRQAIGNEFRPHPMRFTLNVVVPHILAHANWHFGFWERISDPNDKSLLLGPIQRGRSILEQAPPASCGLIPAAKALSQSRDEW